MKLIGLKIRNYRLLVDVEIDVDKEITLIVGRNNSGKTSIFNFIEQVLSDKNRFVYEDYPTSRRSELASLIKQFLQDEIELEVLKTTIPTPSIDFEISYKDEGADESLGALSEFIIDIDVDVTTAIARAEYVFSPSSNKIKKLFADCVDEATKVVDEKSFKDKLRDVFPDLFALRVRAVDPNDENNTYDIAVGDLRKLFPFSFISAERDLDEGGRARSSSLNALISELFKIEEDDDPELLEKVRDLRTQIHSVNGTMRQMSEKALSDLVEKAIGFGYPNTDDLTLAVLTTLDMKEELSGHSVLGYRADDIEDILPSTHNGLGYKNLLKIAFDLAVFSRRAKHFEASCVPLLLIEEPESHMHPQMQQRFAEYVNEYVEKILDCSVQILITSHSPHIANSFEFSKIRYGRKIDRNIEFLNLMDLGLENDKYKFLKKYLTLSRCDLFFADKVILVEGASERLLLPDMIERCEKEGIFGNKETSLTTQYYSTMEVGGAYAHIFAPLIEFLGIPCLILTDIDPVDENRRKVALVSRGVVSSNCTIKWWAKENGVAEGGEAKISDLLGLPDGIKTIENIHIEYQVTEDGYCGRSFEESIRNVNRSLFGLDPNCEECDLEFTGKSKTEFALKLLIDGKDYAVPKYVKDGLIWLSAR